MMNFWQTMKVALRLPYAKISFAMMILGPMAAFGASAFIEDKKTVAFVMMVIVFITSMFAERFCNYVKAVRMEDMKRNGLITDEKPAEKNRKGKKKKR